MHCNSLIDLLFILNAQNISWRSSKFEISWFVWTSFQTFQILFSILLIPDTFEA